MVVSVVSVVSVAFVAVSVSVSLCLNVINFGVIDVFVVVSVFVV